MLEQSRERREAIEAAYAKLSPEEKFKVDELAKQLAAHQSGIKNVGMKTAIEILAAVGICLVLKAP